ncbi:MAG TPA: hypothetical protein DD412_05540, partial [Holosporales bacterium]|nr:hypothetical protein [Holosporales bacterium]
MMEEYSEDDLSSLSLKISSYNKNISRDEIGTMAIAFERMVSSISARTAEKERAEKKLAAEHERLLVTLRSIGDGVVTSDIDGKIVLLNRVAEHLTGWSQADAAGKSVSEVFKIVDERTGKTCADPVARILNSGKIITLDKHTILIDKEGGRRNVAEKAAQRAKGLTLQLLTFAKGG